MVEWQLTALSCSICMLTGEGGVLAAVPGSESGSQAWPPCGLPESVWIDDHAVSSVLQQHGRDHVTNEACVDPVSGHVFMCTAAAHEGYVCAACSYYEYLVLARYLRVLSPDVAGCASSIHSLLPASAGTNPSRQQGSVA